MTKSEIANTAKFSTIRYAQCWEDADILLEALDIQPGHTCLSIASAGDNALAILSKGPARVIAIDLNPAQLACLELRVAAYRELSHPELLELVGSTPSDRRELLYRRCRAHLSPTARNFWDDRRVEIATGIGGLGKFERYFAIFRRRVLPLVHSRSAVERMLAGGSWQERHNFYRQEWNTWRWQLMFRLFFSRLVMGRLGRDPSFFNYVEGSVALRSENFEAIRDNLDRLEWHCQPVEAFLDTYDGPAIDGYNLSDIFEYMSPPSYHRVLQKLVRASRPGGRLAYWNMLAPRSRPESMAAQLRPLSELARRLHLADKAFFYSNFVVEEVS
jgi:S-adenosylmethionine-diacylglycerol 3-amino-3-carboxypropyl transferase